MAVVHDLIPSMQQTGFDLNSAFWLQVKVKKKKKRSAQLFSFSM